MMTAWCQLTPDMTTCKADGNGPVSMTFPTLANRRYAIVRSEDNDFKLVEFRDNLANVSASLMVAENSEVRLRVEANSIIPVQVNGGVVEQKGISNGLNDGDRVKLENLVYIFKYLPYELGLIWHETKGVTACPSCQAVLDSPRLLRCGHTICNFCLQTKVRQAMTAPRAPTEQLFEGGLGAAMDPDEILQQTRMITCDVCKTPWTCYETSKAIRPIALSKAIGIMSIWVENYEKPPLCVKCKNARCLVGPGDYEYCERCRVLLCPPCALESHRDHELRNHADVVKEMHKEGKRLAVKKVQMKNLRLQEGQLIDKTTSNSSEFQRQRKSMQLILDKSLENCHQLLEQFEVKANPFSDVGDQLFNRFQAQVEKSCDQMGKAKLATDRLDTAVKEQRAELMPPGTADQAEQNENAQ